MKTRRRYVVLVAVLVLVVAACGSSDEGGDEEASGGGTETTAGSGGGSDDGANANTPSGEESTATTQDIVEEAEEQLEDAFDTAGGMATVSIDDESWQFELSEEIPIAVCDADFFGGFVAILTTSGADLSGTPFDSMEVRLPGGDYTDPPYVKVTLAINDELEWTADETIYEQSPDLPAGLGVTDFSIDGGTASGTAVFYEEESFFQFNAGLADLSMAEGTFEVSCVAE